MTASCSSELAADYEALRRGVGAYRLDNDVVLVHGPEAGAYLQGQLSCDVAAVDRIGASSPGLLLEPNGKLCALVRATRTDQDAYAIDTDGGWGEAVVARLLRFKLRTRADVEVVAWPVVALRGAGARLDTGVPPPPFVLEVEWNGVTGVDIMGPGAPAQVQGSSRWVGEDAWEALRVEAGIPRMGAEIDGKTIAAEAGLVRRAVSFTKGCYTGQELVARLEARGSKVARRLCGVVVEDARGLDANALRGAPLKRPDSDSTVGSCTSSAWCPGVGSLVALAYLHRSVDVPAHLSCVLADGARVSVEARSLPLVAG